MALARFARDSIDRVDGPIGFVDGPIGFALIVRSVLLGGIWVVG